MPLFSSLVENGQIPLPASFYEVKCAQGYQCVSTLKDFGMQHDGTYTKPPPPKLEARYAESYEVGCPAMGKVNENGACQNMGEEENDGGMCWSTKRYEAGEGTPCDADDKCFCVRPATSHGMGVQNKADEVIHGKEIRFGKWDVQPAANCDDCTKYNCDKDTCDTCINCEFTTKETMTPDGNGGYFGRNQLGCFKVNGGDDRDPHPYLYLKGGKSVARDLAIVPHYKLWDPVEKPEDDSEDGSLRMPFQSRREPLGKEAWVEQYPNAASAIQKLMDILAMRMLDGTSQAPAWSPLANQKTGERRLGLDYCWEFEKGGDGIPDKVDKFLSAQRMCKEVQETARLIANGSSFSAEKDACGAYMLDPTQGIRICGCYHGNGKEAGVCKSLNCYNDREDIHLALEQLREKNKQCGEATKEALALAKAEKVALAPISPDLHVLLVAAFRSPITPAQQPPADRAFVNNEVASFAQGRYESRWPMFAQSQNRKNSDSSRRIVSTSVRSRWQRTASFQQFLGACEIHDV